MKMATANGLELWGGVECTVNRVGNRFFNQLERSGHWRRQSDLDLFAELGLRTLRFPLLWETLAQTADGEIDWSWSDRRMARMRDLGIRPIAGLLHHGSGPRGTSLLDPEFPEKFARYAAAVAKRYPFLDAYTPINEPLTTARFSALYGHWYPHASDPASFARALLLQCRGIVMAMRAIREVQPNAQLIQTEDFGKAFSTPGLRYQADFENERRWVTWDLLSGRVGLKHPLRGYFKWAGIPDAELDFFSANPCPPDVIGVNYYVTSERYLDEDLFSYPAETRGGNGRDDYADIAAVRSPMQQFTGLRNRLVEIQARYGLPIAVTEAHIGCTPDEQMRWLMEIWNDCRAARDDGADVRAMTVWSLLGSFDWDSLVTRVAGHYEPGIFDASGSSARPTVLTEVVRSLATKGTFQHPFLAAAGWWRRAEHLERCA
jgi:dTDP-4-dehydrorhamnose reductase